MMKNNNVTLDNELMEVCRGELKETIDGMGLNDFEKLLMLKNQRKRYCTTEASEITEKSKAL